MIEYPLTVATLQSSKLRHLGRNSAFSPHYGILVRYPVHSFIFNAYGAGK